MDGPETNYVAMRATSEEMRQHNMFGTTLPVQEFIEAAWEKKTKEFFRWCRVVVPEQATMDLEGKECPFIDKSHT